VTSPGPATRRSSLHLGVAAVVLPLVPLGEVCS